MKKIPTGKEIEKQFDRIIGTLGKELAPPETSHIIFANAKEIRLSWPYLQIRDDGGHRLFENKELKRLRTNIKKNLTILKQVFKIVGTP